MEKSPTIKPGVLLIGSTIIVIVLNIVFSLSLTSSTNPNSSAQLLGYVMGQVFLFPALVVLLFQFAGRFRNPRSRIKIFLWASILLILSNISNLMNMIKQTAS